MSRVYEPQFQNLLQSKLGDAWDRALTVFHNYGEDMSWDVTNVLLHAVDKGKVKDVIGTLEKHYESHLQFQHPDIRGTVSDDFGVNPTMAMFFNLCRHTLGLQPTT